MKTNSNFASNLSIRLFLRNMTIKDLAKEIDVPYSTFYYQVKHPSALSNDTISKLASYFDISPEALMTERLDSPNGNTVQAVFDRYKETGFLVESKTKRLLKDQITIPFVPQKISAGYGEELLNPEDVEIQTINIMEDLARGVPRESLLAARVKGDSMIDIYIYPDDIVVFAKGIISGDGIYVLSIDNEVMVKRLVFDRLNHSVLIISENKKYPQREAKDDNQSLKILGKVVGWIHANSV